MYNAFRTMISFCLCFAILGMLGHVFPVSAIDRKEPGTDSMIPYSYGKQYNTFLNGCTYSDDYADDGTMLTDRKFASTAFSQDDKVNWVGYTSTGRAFTVEVLIDLGYMHEDMRQFTVSFLQKMSYGIFFPNEVKYEISADGKTFTPVGYGTWDCDTSEESYCGLSSLTLADGYRARYVRVTISASANTDIFLCEVIVEGRANVTRIYETARQGDTYTDSQGVEYTLQDGQAIVTGYNDLGWNVAGGSVAASDVNFNAEGVYTLGAESGNPVTVQAEFASAENINCSNLTNDIRNIVIHNTGTVEESTTAIVFHKQVLNDFSDSSWHYSVDNSNIIYHSIPDTAVAWHAGSEENYSSIGIEMCVNGAPKKGSSFLMYGDAYQTWLEDVFLQTIENTAVLVAELLVRYELTTDAVIQHNDCSGKNCPQWLRYCSADGKYRHDGDLWLLLMARITYYYGLLTNQSRLQLPASDVVLPEYLLFYNGISYPVTTIASGAFACKNAILCSIEFSNTITTVEDGAFICSYGLHTVSAKNNKLFTEIDGCLYDLLGNLLFEPQLNNAALIPVPDENSPFWIEQSDSGEYWLCGATVDLTLQEICRLYGAESATFYGDKAATGTIVIFDGSPMRLVLQGDANGDGKLNALDYVIAKRYILGSYTPSPIYRRSLMLTNGHTVIATDYIKLKRSILGTYRLEEMPRAE